MLKPYLQLPRPVHILCAGTLVNRAGSFVLVYLTLYISEDLKLGVPFATLCIGILGFGSLVASLVGGQLADQIGRRFVMLLSLFGGASMLIVLSFLRNKYSLASAIFVFALLNEMYRPAASAMIGDLVTPAERPIAFGLMYIAINLGFAIAPPIGGILATYSFSWLFWGDGATTALYGLIILTLIQESRPRTAGRGFPVQIDGETADDTKETSPIREIPSYESVSIAEAARRILSDSTFLFFCLGTLCITLVFMQSLSTLQLYMTTCGLTKAQIGWLLAINGAMIFILQLPLTHALSRFNRMTMIAVGWLIIGIGTGLTAFAHVAWSFAACIAIWTLGEIMQAPLTHSIVSDLAPPELRGRYMGLFNMSFSMAMMIGSPLGGIVLSRYGGEALWVCCFGFGLVSTGVILLLHRRVMERTFAASIPADSAEH
ncbi:MAG: MFS transporter [Phycisphaerales bacterium]|nr:MFS transporter [Phycisphaerales bacterium]MCB9855598.1 MFS transporter [Phycisphaerales bacterium]MCB9864913.1 MFS transporter [Phycisphaerales bacterium]